MLTNLFKRFWALLVKFFIFILTRLEVNDYYLVLNGNHEHIMKRLGTEDRFNFLAKAQEALIKRGDAKEIEALLKNKVIATRKLKQLIIDRNQSYEISLLCQNNHDVPAADIIRQGHFKALLSLLQKGEISEEDMNYILLNFTHFQMMEVLNVNSLRLTEAQMRLLINRVNDDEIAMMLQLQNHNIAVSNAILETIIISGYKKAGSYLAENNRLHDDLAWKYLHRYADDTDMLDDYIYNNDVPEKLQLEIIKNFSHSAVMSLLENDSELSKEAQLAVIAKGNMDEIKRLIKQQNSLSDEVIDALFKRNVHEEMQLLAQHQKLKNSVLMQWVNNCRFDYVEMYLKTHSTDASFNTCLLLEVLKRTVK